MIGSREISPNEPTEAQIAVILSGEIPRNKPTKAEAAVDRER